MSDSEKQRCAVLTTSSNSRQMAEDAERFEMDLAVSGFEFTITERYATKNSL